MALKSTYSSEEKGAEIEEALDGLDKLVDRVKVLYEQYFMGIQKQAPAHLHLEAERRLRDLTQMQIRNTALRYRFATLQQKFGSYNTYWKRTLREIEAGRYIRNLIKVRQKALAAGEDIPEEIVAKMPKRMRDAIARDREQAIAKAQREGKLERDVPPAVAELEQDSDTQPDLPRFAPPPDPRAARPKHAAHKIEDPFADDGDIAAALSSLTDDALAAVEAKKPAAPPLPPLRPGPPPIPRSATPPPIPRPPTAGPAPIPRPPTAQAGPGPRAPTAPPAGPIPRATTHPAVPRAPTSPPAPSPIPGMSEADTRALYAKYVKAREVVGDRTDPMSYDRLVRTLSSQAPRIIETHKASGVEFNVVIKDNKVVLKAKPK